MKVLYLGCKKFSWSAISKLAVPEKIEPDSAIKKNFEVENALVCMTAIEKNDTLGIIENSIVALQNIIADCQKKTGKIPYKWIVLYPYAHIGGNKLGSAKLAKKLIAAYFKKIKILGSQLKIMIVSAPFGWAKSINLQIDKTLENAIQYLGEYTSENSTAVQNVLERRVIKIGNLDNPFQFQLAKDYIDYELKKYVSHNSVIPKYSGTYYHTMGGFNPLGQPYFIRAGYHTKKRLQNYITKKTFQHYGDLNMMESSPLYYAEDQIISEHTKQFPSRQFNVFIGPKKYMLRYATCPQAIKHMEKQKLSSQSMPYRIYEMADCYRHEKSGQVQDIRRLTKFTMPDMHSLIAFTKESIISEFIMAITLHFKIITNLGFLQHTIPHLQIESEFAKKNPELILKLKELFINYGYSYFVYGEWAGKSGCYYQIKWELQYKKYNFLQLSTVQLDTSPGHIDKLKIKNNAAKSLNMPVAIVHSSVGSTERLLCAMFETNYFGPLKTHKAYVIGVGTPETQDKIAKIFKNSGVVLDVRQKDLRKKIKKYQMEFSKLHPLKIVVGAQELKSNSITIENVQKKTKVKLDDYILELKLLGLVKNIKI